MIPIHQQNFELANRKMRKALIRRSGAFMFCKRWLKYWDYPSHDEKLLSPVIIVKLCILHRFRQISRDIFGKPLTLLGQNDLVKYDCYPRE